LAKNWPVVAAISLKRRKSRRTSSWRQRKKQSGTFCLGVTGNSATKLRLSEVKMGTIILLAALNCYGLSPDQRSYCQAREQNNPAYCYSISDQALRTACRAEIHEQPDICSGIADSEQRQLCRNRAVGK